MLTIERYWTAPIPAARIWFIQRTFYLLFAFDAFADHVGPAWRYGTADFNVAHWRWMSAILPMPTSGLYLTVIFGVGLAAFVCAVAPRPPRELRVAIALGYLWSWSCSMHDSYQHHYLISMFFIAFSVLPKLSLRDLFGPLATNSVDTEEKTRATRIATESTTGLRVKTTKSARTKSSATKSSATKSSTTKSSTDRTTKECRPSHQSSRYHLPHGWVPLASAWGLVLVWTTSAVVYSYTALSKTEPEWLSGAALRNITSNGAPFRSVVELAAAFGIEDERFWNLLGASVVLLQVGCAAGYALCPMRERLTGRPRRFLDLIAWLALALALSFHAGAEFLGLQIGWFSWYMILLALGSFLPASWLGVALVLMSDLQRNWKRSSTPPELTRPALGVASAVLVAIMVGPQLGVPGLASAFSIASVALLAALFVSVLKVEWRSNVQTHALVTATGMAVLSLALARSGERFDYWRFAGGDFRRRGELIRSLEAYEEALRVAPVDERDRIRSRVYQLRRLTEEHAR